MPLTTFILEALRLHFKAFQRPFKGLSKGMTKEKAFEWPLTDSPLGGFNNALTRL